MTEDGTDPPPRDGAPVPICAIGGSAGGMEALRTFFQHVRTDLGLAYLVVIHLAPDRPSMLSEILSKDAKMPVEAVRDVVRLEPDHIYVVAPDRELVVADGTVTARPFAEPRGQRKAIDHLLESLAAGRDTGIGVVLSGEGTDGTAGARALREAGGVVLVQDLDEAAHDGMPGTVISSGHADVVAPVAALADRVADIAAAPSLAAVQAQMTEETAEEMADKARGGAPLKSILQVVHRRLGHDFSQYKPATVLRRIERRMQLSSCESLADYATFLQSSDEEQARLFADLLISVTSFFRDPDAFEAIATEAIRPILDRKDGLPDAQVRVWSVGCATGEEAYSLAILLLEEAERRQMRVPVQVFATDIDTAALAKARAGIYGREIESDVSAARLKRFFVRHEGGWRVRKELRELVLFAEHSLTKDPPFIHLDLVSCRNLLIYLNRDLQRQVCNVLHYALDPGGFLVLGSAETMEAASDMFRPVNREMRIYAAQPTATPRPAGLRPMAAVVPDLALSRPAGAAPSELGPGRMHLAALEASAPPSVLVAADRRTLHLSPGAGRFMTPSGGPASLDVTATVRPELRLDLGFALHRAFEDGEATFSEPVGVAFNGARHRVVMYVTPDRSAEEPAARALVLFLEGGAIPAGAPPDRARLPDDMRRMVRELGDVHDRLARSQGANERALQELRAANEELQSMNEEYRSTSEELETSKEELQSMNEELQTVNDEVKSKLESLSEADSDLRNLMAATEYGTLFLDPELKVKLFTPQVTAVFKLTESDIGRPITDFASTLDNGHVSEHARAVLKDLAPQEFDAAARDGRWYKVRLRPYRTIDDRIDGIVVTLIDITGVHDAAEATRERERRFVALLRATTDATFRMSPDWSRMLTLQSEALLIDSDQARADWLQAYIPEEDRERVRAAVEAAIARKSLFELEHRVRLRDGGTGWVLSRATPILERDGSIGEWFGIATDISARKSSEAARALVSEVGRHAQDSLGLVLSIFEQTRGEAVPAGVAAAFEGRVRALADAHDALARSGSGEAELGDLARGAVRALGRADGARVHLDGPTVALGATAATGLRLALHELATNALQHGALAAPEGWVAVSWRVAAHGDGGARRLTLEWREADGPPAAPPAHKGFGVRYLEERLPRDLGGMSQLDFAVEGLTFRLEAPV